jgi:serine/threonine-protein kinase
MRVWSAGKIVVLVGALIATYAIFAAVAVRLALRAREVTVPDLTNRTTSDASTDTAALGLALRIDDLRRPDPKIAAGRVIMQDPAAGSVARRKRTIKVWLSAGQRAMLVPALAGETERTAQLRLRQNGLALSAVSEIRSDAYPVDVVVAQQPPARSPPERTLLVNRGARGATYVMPDLIGLNGGALRTSSAAAASAWLSSAQPLSRRDRHIVLRQNPQAGFQIGPSEPIGLEVSR